MRAVSVAIIGFCVILDKIPPVIGFHTTIRGGAGVKLLMCFADPTVDHEDPSVGSWLICREGQYGVQGRLRLIDSGHGRQGGKAKKEMICL